MSDDEVVLNSTINPNFPDVRDVEPETVLKHQKKLRLIDVRQPHEFTGELGHIPNSENLILDILPQNISKLSPDETIVFICRSGQRSAHAASFCLENGFSKVYNMRGGMILWNEKKFATEGTGEA